MRAFWNQRYTPHILCIVLLLIALVVANAEKYNVVGGWNG